MGRARYNTGLFPLPDNVLPVQLFGGTSERQGVCDVCAQPPKIKATTQSRQIPPHYTKHKKYLLSKQQQKSSQPSPRPSP